MLSQQRRRRCCAAFNVLFLSTFSSICFTSSTTTTTTTTIVTTTTRTTAAITSIAAFTRNSNDNNVAFKRRRRGGSGIQPNTHPLDHLIGHRQSTSESSSSSSSSSLVSLRAFEKKHSKRINSSVSSDKETYFANNDVSNNKNNDMINQEIINRYKRKEQQTEEAVVDGEEILSQPPPKAIVPLSFDRIKSNHGTYSPQYLADNGLELLENENGQISVRPKTIDNKKTIIDPSKHRRDNKGKKLNPKEQLKKPMSTLDSTRPTSNNQQQQQQHKQQQQQQHSRLNTKNSGESVTTTSTKLHNKHHQKNNHNNNINKLQQEEKNSNNQQPKKKEPLVEYPPKVVAHQTGFNVILTHCTADFDSLASAVGLAKLWSHELDNGNTTIRPNYNRDKDYDSASHAPTFVVLPRGAHPGVQRFLALHKHLFPIRSLKSLPEDLSSLNRLALVDAQRRDRIGPASTLLEHAKRITVVDHHVDQDSDIPATDYVVDKVGSVSTLITERLMEAGIALTEAEATLLALGIHGDTGSLCFDSTTSRDAYALAWCLDEGASQAAIAEHAQSSLSVEQQGVLTQALINTNTAVIHGVSISTVLLSADGFIQGLATVTQDALDLSSSDIFLLALVYEARPGSSRKKRKKGISKSELAEQNAELFTSKLLAKTDLESGVVDDVRNSSDDNDTNSAQSMKMTTTDSKSEENFRRTRLRAAFDRIDLFRSGYIGEKDVAIAISSSGIVLSDPSTVSDLINVVDKDGDGKIDFEEFVDFSTRAEKKQDEENNKSGRKSTTMIIIGRVKAGVNMKAVKLNKLLEKFGGGGHPKAASATVRLDNEMEAQGVLQNLVDELIQSSLTSQPCVADFMTSPVLSVKPHMNEKQVEDLFTRYGVRALPVVDDKNEVVGLVSYQLVAAAKQRLWNKEQKRFRQEQEAAMKGIKLPKPDEKIIAERKRGTAVKAWMLQHVQTVEESMTMSEVETILLENDVGSLPVVADGTKKLVGMVTRTDILRQHRYYDSLAYHNKGFADSIAARKPIIELRKKLKQFDLD